MPSDSEKPTVSVKLSKKEPAPAAANTHNPSSATGPTSNRDGTSTSSTSQPGAQQTLPSTKGTLSQPCLISGFYSAASAGMLGFFFGAIPSMAKNRTLSARGLWAADGWKSAQALGLVSGMYTWIHCLCQRIRLKDDGINRGAAGCATGLVLGWKGGPASALQSCVGFGLISYILDFGGHGDAPHANAAVVSSSGSSSGGANLRGSSTCCLAGPGLHGQQTTQQRPGCSDLCGITSQGVGTADGPARVVLVSRHAGQQMGKLHRQWWQRQCQRQLELPPVMWLGSVLRPGYFNA